MEERKISEDSVFKGHILHVYRDQVQLTNGQESFREIVKVAPAVAIVALQGTDLLLVRQFRYAVGKSMLEIPAGRLNPGESPLACAQRELQEETGYAGALMPLGSFQMAVGYSNEVIHFFWTENLSWNPLPLDQGEYVETVTMPWPEALNQATSGKIEDAKTVLGILLTHWAKTNM